MSVRSPKLYDENFYRKQSDASYTSAKVVVPLVMRLLTPSSVCDFGCGVGTWLLAFLENGADVIAGFDGAYVSTDQLKMPSDCFTAVDLAQPFVVPRKFDLAVSLEVAEHLPAGRAESFVKNLTDAADAVLFGAAIPGQKGVGHLNLRWQSYWASLFKAQGLDAFDPIRPCVWNDERVCWWYRQNTLLYARATVVSRMPALRATHAKNLDMVHPQCYLQRTDVDELGFVAVTKLLPSLIGDAIGRRVTDKKSKGRQDQSSQVGAAEGSTFD